MYPANTLIISGLVTNPDKFWPALQRALPLGTPWEDYQPGTPLVLSLEKPETDDVELLYINDTVEQFGGGVAWFSETWSLENEHEFTCDLIWKNGQSLVDMRIWHFDINTDHPLKVFLNSPLILGSAHDTFLKDRQ